jgi:hypothetical protein
MVRADMMGEHAAFLDALTDHDVRITRLETASGTSKPTTS